MAEPPPGPAGRARTDRTLHRAGPAAPERPEADASPAGPEATDTSGPPARPPLAATVGVLAVFVVFVVLGVVESRRTWYPGNDPALLELYVRQIPHHPVDTGPYSSSRGFFHPLPYGFYALWLPYEIFGRASAGLLAGTMWLSGMLLAAVSWVLVRRRRAGLALILVVALGVMARTAPVSMFLMPWNPYQAMLPLLALLVLAPFVAGGDRWLAPAAVAAAGLAAGTHLLFAPPAVVVLGAAFGGLGWTAWRRRRTEPPVRWLAGPLAVSAGVGLLVWLPVVVDVIRRGRAGNTAGIVRFMRDPGAAYLTVRGAITLVTWEFAWRPTWAGAHQSFEGLRPSMRFPVFLVVGGLAAVLAWRRRSRWELSALGFGLLSTVVATYGFARVPDPPGDWFRLPLRVSAIFFCCVAVCSLGRSAGALLARRAPWDRMRIRPLHASMATVALWVGAALLVAWPSSLMPWGTVERRPDVEPIVRSLPAGRPVVVNVASIQLGMAPVGYVLALDRAGLEVHVPESQEWYFGSWRARPAPAGSPRLWIRQPKPGTPPPAPGARLVHRSEPLRQLFGPDLPIEVWRRG